MQYKEILTSLFQQFFGSINKIFILEGILAFRLRAMFVTNNHASFHLRWKENLEEVYFIFLKKLMHQTWKSFNTEFEPQGKDRRSYQVRRNLAFFRMLVTLILGWNYSLRASIIKCFYVSRRLERFGSKKLFPETKLWTKHLDKL